MSINFDRFRSEIVSIIGNINLYPFYSEVGEILLRSIDRNFREGGRYGTLGDDDQWTGGVNNWIESKRALGKTEARGRKGKKGATGPAGHTLLDTGQLAASITKQVTADCVPIGTNKAYAAIHQYGGVTGRNDSVTLPARPFLVVQDEDLEEIERAAADFIGRALRE